MVKLSLFICIIYVSIQIGVSSTDDEFGSFWGPCPEAPINASSRTTLYEISTKWYIHRVLGQYSPWKYFTCQTNNIRYDWRKQTANVTNRFEIPFLPISPVEWTGTVQTVNTKKSKFDFHYDIENWLLTQNTVFLQNYYQGAALTWTCLDFYIFHIESIAVMTQYEDANDSRISRYVFWNMNETLRKSGISPEWFEAIDQTYCNSSASFFSSSALSLNKIWQFIELKTFLKSLYEMLVKNIL